MSVVTKHADSRRGEHAVKNPLAWYMPRFWHGMRFSTWMRGLARNGFAISPTRVPMAVAISSFTALNSVLAAIDGALYSRQIEKVRLNYPPLFILGHWRSGTTTPTSQRISALLRITLC
jgi:omega-hydroxy-beta-dihydromenaquinone-9 sulfotransferase